MTAPASPISGEYRLLRRARRLARFLLLRLPRTALVFLVVSFLVFSLATLVPGDPAVAIAGETASTEVVAAIRHELGLDRPFLVQYGSWLLGVLHGDLGKSIFYQTPVNDLLAQRFPVTMSIALCAILLAAMVGIFAGMLAAARRGRAADRITTGIATLASATPGFWVGMVLVIVFSLKWRLFPPVGYTELADDPLDWLRHLVLPAIALSLSIGSELQRQTRSAISDVLTQDYIRTARAQGMSGTDILFRRALKNGAIPLVTVLGYQISMLLSGSVIIEKVFNISGMGSLAINAVAYKDLPVLQGIVLVNAVVVIVVNLLTDLIYTMLNPRTGIA